MYIIVCTDDSMTYGQKDTLEQAELRAKILAEKNIGKQYFVAKPIKTFQYTYENIKLQEEDCAG